MVNIFIVDILPKNGVFLKYNVRINARETSNFEQLICIDNFLQDILNKNAYNLLYNRKWFVGT